MADAPLHSDRPGDVAGQNRASSDGQGLDQQGLLGYSTNAEWENKLAQVATLIEELEKIKDPAIHGTVFSTLQAIDGLHREALHRLTRLFKEGVLEQVITDPAINTLMGMYDLLPPEAPHCQKVWDFLDDGVQPDDGLFNQYGLSGEAIAHWSPAPIEAPPENDIALLCKMDEGEILVISVGDEIFAIDATCPHHNNIMQNGELNGHAWLCPHGQACVYDIRDGHRTGGGTSLNCFPIKLGDAGQLLIGFGIPFEPKRPAF